MVSLTNNLTTLEETWYKKIETYFAEKYDGIYLPSHDVNHHKRVWAYACQLLKEITKTTCTSDCLAEQIFWACMFHDIGLCISTSEEHGKASMELFREFVYKHKAEIPGIEKVKQAIIEHDNKNYASKTLTFKHPYDFVSIADDLDAYGYAGIYRYTEIYYLRGIEIAALPIKVLENVTMRFMHFSKNCSQYTAFYKTHRQRYLIIHNYFSLLNSDISEIGLRPYYYIGTQGVLNQLIDLVKNNIELTVTYPNKALSQADAYVINMFNKIVEEYFV